MQSVTQEYKESMQGVIRNRGYIRVTIGNVNQEAQENIRLSDDTQTTYFSNNNIFDDYSSQKIYATCEENFSVVDGTMYFVPNVESEYNIYNNGIVVNDFLVKATFNFKDNQVYDIFGFTIDFGDNYPTEFDIVSGSDVLHFTDNNTRYFIAEQGLHNVSTLEIVPIKMKAGDNSRLRILSLTMGITNVFTNNEVISYNQNDYVSSISDSLPSTDIDVTVANYDQYFNPDNENSAFAFLEEGQKVRTRFGYDVTGNGDIEWLPEKVSYLKAWEASDREAKFKSTDVFDMLSGTYYKGIYNTSGTSAYDLAIDVLEDANVKNYRVDTYLRDILIYNPIPILSHTEALQVIANACRCALYEDRNGDIVIQSDFIPEYIVSSDNQAELSNVANIGNDKSKYAYALHSNEFNILSDDMLLFGSSDTSNLGYVSNSVSDDNGLFEINPTINVTMESTYSPSNLYIQFRNNAPKQFVIKTFLDNVAVDVITVDNPSKNYEYGRQLNFFDYMEIEFTKGNGNDIITVDKLLFGAPTDYKIKRNMITNSPSVKLDTKIKSISISKTKFEDGVDNKTYKVELSNITNGDYEVYFNNPSYSYTITKDSGSGNVVIKESSCYRVIVTVSDNTDGNIGFTITHKEYSVSNNEKYVVNHNINGIDKTWNNPLISTDEQANKLEKWIADYLLLGITYEFSWRGDPCIDANDLFYLELKSGEVANIRGYQSKISFNGAWSGDMKARKVVV